MYCNDCIYLKVYWWGDPGDPSGYCKHPDLDDPNNELIFDFGAGFEQHGYCPVLYHEED